MKNRSDGGALDAQRALWAEFLAAKATDTFAALDFCLAVFDDDCLCGTYVAAHAAADAQLGQKTGTGFKYQLAYFVKKALYGSAVFRKFD